MLPSAWSLPQKAKHSEALSGSRCPFAFCVSLSLAQVLAFRAVFPQNSQPARFYNSFIFSLAGSSRTPSQRAVARCWGDLRAGFGDFGSSGSSGWGSWGGQQRGGEAAALATSSWGRAAAVDKSRESGPVVKVERAATSTQNRSRRRHSRRCRIFRGLSLSFLYMNSLDSVSAAPLAARPSRRTPTAWRG